MPRGVSKAALKITKEPFSTPPRTLKAFFRLIAELAAAKTLLQPGGLGVPGEDARREGCPAGPRPRPTRSYGTNSEVFPAFPHSSGRMLVPAVDGSAGKVLTPSLCSSGSVPAQGPCSGTRGALWQPQLCWHRRVWPLELGSLPACSSPAAFP